MEFIFSMPRKRLQTDSPMIPSNENKSSILSDVEITGSVKFKGELSFDGQLKDGDIEGESLIAGERARIKGDVKAEALLLRGTVTGDVLVAGRCELKGSANLVGSLTTNRLVMDEGATLIGDVQITPDGRKLPTPPPSEFPTGIASLKAKK
jgi:cytoskeletal protein CcmA (bactofilin family)